MVKTQKTEYKIFVLFLADVRDNVDNAQPIAVFSEKEKLVAWYNSMLTSSWVDNEESTDFFGRSHDYTKTFKKGSALEWFNPPHSLDEIDAFGGVQERWYDQIPEQSIFNIPFDPLPVE